MIELRPYQQDAVDALFGYFSEHDGNPILSLPTGSGKSIIQAAFIKRVLDRWPGERFLLVSHVKEILQQNADKIARLIPGTTVGIYSAGLGRKETGYHVTIAGIQSAYKVAHRMGDISIVIVDECHLVNKTADSMYGKLLASLAKFCPQAKIIGLSATPYRLDSGPLIAGRDRIFTDIAYSISIRDLIDLGYLSPLVTADTRMRALAGGVAKRGGEYVTGDLERYMNQDNMTGPALDEVQALCADRKSLLVFCVGVDHARDVAQAMRMRGTSADVVVGDTPKDVREDRIRRFVAGEIRALVSVGVLTTGFDAPCVDALICLRPTMSPGLWVQIVGRGTRLHPGKTDCLVLDFTNNTREHGPVDLIEVGGDGNVRTSPYRVCPECGALIPPREKACKCGYSFQRECHKCHALFDRDLKFCPDCMTPVPSNQRKIAHNGEASDAKILSDGGEVTTEEVKWIEACLHCKEGKPDSVRVKYFFDSFGRHHSDWLCFDHGGYAQQKAKQKWVRLGGAEPAPATTEEAIERSGELVAPEKITVKKEGKYWRIL